MGCNPTRRMLTRLRFVARLNFLPLPPYHFLGSFIKPSHFRTDDHTEKGGRIWRTLRLRDSIFGLVFEAAKVRSKALVSARVYSSKIPSRAVLAELQSIVSYRFDMNSELSGFVNLVKRSPIAKQTLTRWLGSRPTCGYSLYEFLVICICLQNANIKRTTSMMTSLFSRYGHAVEFCGMRLYVFWKPTALLNQEAELRNLKLGYRAKLLDQLSFFFGCKEPEYENDLRSHSDPKLLKALQEIPSVGKATASYLAFEYFHRYDALTYLPPWETRIYRQILGNQFRSANSIVRFAHRTWPGFSMLALHILFEDHFRKLAERNILLTFQSNK